MAVDFKTILESLLPPGTAWAVKSGGDFDNLLEGMANAYGDIKESLGHLANIRNPDSTQILSDLEHEYGIIPDTSLTEAERRESLNGVVYAKPGMGADHLTAELHKAGFTDLFAYQNDPLTNPEFYLDGTWSAWCGGEDSFCGGEDAYCGYASGGSGYLLINDNAADATTGVPNDSTIWHLVFFVGGTKTSATAGYFLLADGDMEDTGTTEWTSGPGSDTTLTKETDPAYEGSQSLRVELTDGDTVADPESFYGHQDLGVDTLDTGLVSAPIMRDNGTAVLYDTGFDWSDKSRANGENGDAADVLGFGVKAGGTNATDKLAIDFLDAQLARFSGDIGEDEGTLSCWAKINDMSRTPTFDLVPGEAAGYGDLPQDLTINGTTVSPTFRYEAQDADATSWDATVGDDLPIASTGTDPDFDALAPGPSDYRVSFNSGTVYAAPNSTAGAISTDDFVFEIIYQHTTTTSYVFSKTRASAAVGGWGFLAIADELRLVLSDASVSATLSLCSGLVDGKWYHISVFGDRSGYAKAYVNGVGQTAASGITSVTGSLDSTDPLVIGARNPAPYSAKTDASVAFISMWHSAAWLDSHSQPDVAQERASIAMGIYPQIAQEVESTTFSMPATSSGYAALGQNLTANGVTKTPTFRYEAGQASASAWLATVGDDLPIAGSGTDPVVDEYSPGLTDSRVKFGGGKSYQVADTSFANASTDDIIIEYIGTTGANPERPIGKRGSGAGYQVYDSTNRLTLYLSDGTNTASIHSLASLAPNTFYHFLWVIDASGSGVCYTNGVIATAASVSAVGDMDNTTAFALGLHTSVFTGSIAYAAMWQGAGWLDTHLQADLAAERFGKACGIWPELAASGLYAPEVASRSTVAYIDKIDTNGDSVLVPVGANWMRVCERVDLADDTLSGYLAEQQSTNLVLTSEGGTGWASIDAGDTVNLAAEVAPDGQTTALELIADSTDGQHGYSHGSLTLTAASYTASVWAKIGDVDFLKLEISTITNAYAYFDISNGTVETEGAAATGRISGPYIGDYYRCEITFTGTAAVHTFQVLSCNADNDDTFAGDGVTTNTYLWGMQVETVAYASTRIETTGSTATRVKDQLRFHAGENIGGEDRGVIRVDFDTLIPCHSNAFALYGVTVSDGGSSTNRIYVYVYLNTGTYASMTSTGGNVGASLASGDVASGVITSLKANGKTNYLVMSKDGIPDSTPDTLCDVPDDLDRIDVGQSSNTSSQLGGLLGNLKIYSTFDGTSTGYLPKTLGRASEALVEKVLPGDTEVALIPVGANWMRVDRVFDRDLDVVQGYRAESEITNLLTYSDDFGNAAWTKTNAAITSDAITGLGDRGFDAVVGDGTSGIHAVAQAVTTTGTGAHVVSAYVKAGDKDFVYVDVSEVTNGYCYFDLTDGSYSLGAGVDGAYAEYKGDGIYRIFMSVSVPGATATVRFAPSDDGTYTFTGDSATVNGYIFGAQIEYSAGDLNFPTSYIATGTAAATREADKLTMYGSENVGGENFDVVTLRAEFLGAYDRSWNGWDGYIANIGDGSALNRAALTSGPYNAVVDMGGVNQASLNTAVAHNGTKYTFELGAKLDDFRLFRDRDEEDSDTSGDMPTGLVNLKIGQRWDSTSQPNGIIPRVTVSPYGQANPRGIMGAIDPATGMGPFIAYDDRFDGTFELLASVLADGVVQMRSDAAVLPAEGEWFHVALTWAEASGTTGRSIIVNGSSVESGHGSAVTEVLGAPIILGAVALKGGLAGGAVSIAQPKCLLIGLEVGLS